MLKFSSVATAAYAGHALTAPSHFQDTYAVYCSDAYIENDDGAFKALPPVRSYQMHAYLHAHSSPATSRPPLVNH